MSTKNTTTGDGAQSKHLEQLVLVLTRTVERLQALEDRLGARERARAEQPQTTPRIVDTGRTSPLAVTSFEIGINNGGLQLSFGFTTTGTPGVLHYDTAARVQLIPQTAKALARQLMRDVDRFEATHGPICTPEESHRRWTASAEK